MSNSRHFLIISLIAHVLMFLVLAYIVLPPVNFVFLDSLYVDFVKLKPVVRNEVPVRDKVEPEAEPEAERSEEPEGPKPPAMETFYVQQVEKPVADGTRGSSGEKVPSLKIQTKGRGMASVRPPAALNAIPRPTDNGDITVLPEFYKDMGSITDTGKTDFSGHQVGPLGSEAGGRGASENFINILYGAYGSGTTGSGATQLKKNGDEFGDILPELAQGIVKRTDQKKVDIVFVIDTTASMRDNVRGVKDYISNFLMPIQERELDAELGLVEFADEKKRKAKALGLTGSQKKFRKWLDKTIFMGGDDIPESGYEALIAALEDIDFRKDAQKFFIFISDAPQHDLDYDGQSRYTLDRIIARLTDEGVTVDVVGANYLAVKQLAWGTGGQWRNIPGNPLMEIPHPVSSMLQSSLAMSVPPVPVEDKVTIKFDSSTPDWVDLSYKMLGPRGRKRLGTLTYRIKVPHGSERKVEFSPKIDLSEFRDQPGTYTLIYRIRDSIGNRDILRRTFELK